MTNQKLPNLSAILFATSIAVGCVEKSPTEGVNPTAIPGFGIVDGAHGGNPGFYFLPPIAPSVGYAGEFDPFASPTVRICLVDVASCNQTVVADLPAAKVHNSHYELIWHSASHQLIPGATYRIEVRSGAMLLGSADIQAVASASNQGRSKNSMLSLVVGSALPIRFRIEVGSNGSLRDPATVIVDPDVFALLSSDEERASGIYRFQRQGNGPEIRIGTILVGQTNGGYLRRVESVSKSGNVISVVTTPATLENALTRGTLSASIPLGASSSSLTTPARVVASTIGQAAQVIDGAVVLDGTTLFTGQSCTGEGGRCATVNLTIPSGRIELDQVLDLGVHIDNSTLREFHAIASGQVTVTADVLLSTTEEFSLTGEVVLARYARPFVVGGLGIPVFGVAEVALVGSYEASATVEGTISGGFLANGSISVGARYSDGEWSGVFDPATNFTARPVSWGGRMEATVTLAVRPVVAISLYGVGGPFLALKAYLAGSGSIDLNACRLIVDLTAGINAEVGLGFSQLAQDVLGEIEPYTETFPGPSRTLYHDERLLEQTCATSDFTFNRSMEVVSPSGRRFFLGKIYLGSLNGGAVQLSPNDDTISDGTADFSPDGRRLAITRAILDPEGRVLSGGIYVMNADGSGARFLTTGSAAAWSPDGLRIAFHDKDPQLSQIDQEIFVINADGSGRRQVTFNTTFDLGPRWSIDNRIVYQCSNRACINNPDAPGPGQPLPGLANGADWSADGTRVLVASTLGGLVYPDIGNPNLITTDIWSMKPDGSDPQRITTLGLESWGAPSCVGCLSIGGPRSSKDGRYISFVVFTFNGGDYGRSGDHQYYVVNTDGTNARPILQRGENFLSWRP